MKPFEKLKEWEVKGLRVYKSYPEYCLGDFPKIGRIFIFRLDYPEFVDRFFLIHIGYSSSKKWGLRISDPTGKPLYAKTQATLREAYNFAREIILKAQAGEPIQKYLLP